MAEVSSEFKALKQCEVELISCLQLEDILTLAGQAVDCKLTPYKVKTNLESLHTGVSHSLRCRYLLYNVYNSIVSEMGETNMNAYQHWANLLLKLKAAAEVCSQIRHYRRGMTESLAGRVTSMGTEGVRFTRDDISDLAEVLAGCSSRWKEIATSLGVPDNEIKNTVAMMHMYSPVMCLKKILSLWVMCQNTPPTLEQLERTLCSKIVGLGSEAYNLRNNLAKLDEERCSNHDTLMAQTFEIVSQTRRFDTAEGNCVLVEVQVHSSLKYQLRCEWHKDNCLLNLAHSDRIHAVSNSYLHSHCFILCLSAKDITTEGTYTCIIECGREIFKSDPITLNVTTSIDQYIHILTDSYIEQPEVYEDSWPPVIGTSYVDLALIKREGINPAWEYGGNTIRRDENDAYKEKRVDLKTVLNSLNGGSRLLIEGCPGSGKTTLVHKISKDWARGKIVLKWTKAVFLLHLRDFAIKPDVKFRDVLECFYSCSSTLDDFVKYGEKHSGSGLCFILDGLDEYQPQNSTTFIYKLIKKQVLPKSVIVATSTPAAAARFRTLTTCQVEVVGFSKAQIHNYVDNYPFAKHVKYEGLHTYLDEHPNIHRMCYLPMHAAMVCFLFDNLEADLPQTETEMYKEFTKYTILRNLYRNDYQGETSLCQLEDLKSPQNDIFIQICKLAHEMTSIDKQVMQKEEICTFVKSCSERECLGFLTTDNSRLTVRYGFQKMYCFLHHTFQDFLGAYYISSLVSREQLEMIKRFGKAVHMKQVWIFYCGLLKFDGISEDIYKFCALMEATEYGTLFGVQCSFESQQPRTCSYVVEGNRLCFTLALLSPSDFAAIAYVISNSEENSVSDLFFDKCIFLKEGVYAFNKILNVKRSNISCLNFHGQKCSIEQLQALNCLINVLSSSLKHLDISDTDLGILEITAVAEGLNLPNLRTLQVGCGHGESRQLPKTLADTFVAQCKGLKEVRIRF